jgi:hypothetical protein
VAKAYDAVGHMGTSAAVAFTPVPGQSNTITLIPLPGMHHGMSAFQGFLPLSLLNQKSLAAGQAVITIPPPPPTAVQVTIYLQVYSLTHQGSSANHTLAIQR